MKFLLLLLLSFASFARTTEGAPIEINDSEIISSSFSNGNFDSTKLELVLMEVKEKQNAAFLNYCQSNLPEDATDNTYCLSAEKNNLQQNWRANLYNRTYQQIINLFTSAIEKGKGLNQDDLKTQEGREFVRTISLALQVYENTKLGALIPKDVKTFDYLGKLGSFFRSYSIENPKDPSINDLPGSIDSLVVTKKNTDISIIEESAEEIAVTFDFSHEDFPFVVKYRGEKWAIRFPTEVLDVPDDHNPLDGIDFKIRPNTPQVGQVLGRMAKELGYNVYPSTFKKKVRVYFSQADLTGSSYQILKNKMLAKLSESYPQEILPKSIFDDSNEFIELKGVSLQKIYDKNKYLSFNGFPISSAGNQNKRAYRALALFAAWVDLPFLDDTIGAGIFDVKNVSLNHMLYNLDYGLGYGYPNLFKNKLVKKVHRKNGVATKIDLTYKPFHKTDLFSKMTLADAKWMAEKIAEFTPEQIKSIFLESGFPEIVANIFVKKLMDRRNQILEAFDLINEKTSLEQGWNNTIEGHEQYFTKDGFLIDPKGEFTTLVDSSFPIYWSTTWFAKRDNHGFNQVAFKNYGRRLLSTLNALGTGSLHLGPGYYNNGFTFQEFGSNSNSGFTGCTGSCFFQGLNIGASALLPYRFVMENPDKTSPKRFLIVDLFRLAIRAGVGSDVVNGLGISAYGLQPLGNAHVFSVFEFIKIHPADSFKEYTEGYKEGVKTPGLPIFGLQKKFIESMEQDDSILINKYIGSDMEIGVRWAPPIPIEIVSAKVGIQAKVFLLGSKVLHKEADENVILNFSKLTAKQLSIFARLEVLGFLDRNLLGTGVGLSLGDFNKRDQVFLFDLKNENDNNTFYESIKALTPKKIPDEYKLSERIIHTKQSEISTRLTSFMGHDRKTKKIEAQFQNFTDGTSQKEYAFTRRLDTFLNKNERIYNYKSSINEKGDMFLKVNTSIKFNNVTRERFAKFYPLIKQQTPEDFIVFDINTVDEDMGDVEFNSTMILSGSGIQKLLNLSENELCRTYVEEKELDKCEAKDYPIGLKLLINDLRKTQDDYKQLGPNADKKSIFDVLRRLTNLPVHHWKNESLIKIFENMIPQQDFFQQSSLTSEKAAFPGKINEINLSRRNKGSFMPSARHLAETTEEAYAIFSDQLFYTMRNYIFSRDPSLEYPRNGFLTH